MYNLYNLEARQPFLINYRTDRKANRFYKMAEVGVIFIVFISSFFWLFV